MVNPFPPDCAQHFRPERMPARGGFGTVWLATQLKLERPVAVKLLHSDLLTSKHDVQRFLTEARVTAALSHPGIVRVIDHGVFTPAPLDDEAAARAGVPWIVYEYLPGRSLSEILKQGALPWADALSVAAQIAAALEEAHGHQVLHRDIKPSNILEASTGVVKVTDFGIAKWAQRGVKTATGMILGTPLYISPEQVAGKAPAPASDLYSLGVLTFEMLTGRLPFQSPNPQLLLNMHQAAPPPPPSTVRPDLPPGIDALVLKALAKSPEQRYASAAAMKAALESFTPRPPALDGSAARRRARGIASAAGLPRGAPATEVLEPEAAAPAAPERSSPALPRRPVAPANVAARAAMVGLAGSIAVWLAMRPAPPRAPSDPTASASGAPLAREPALRPSERLDLETRLEELAVRVRDARYNVEVHNQITTTIPDVSAGIAAATRADAREAETMRALVDIGETLEHAYPDPAQAPHRDLRLIARARASRFLVWCRRLDLHRRIEIGQNAIRKQSDTVVDVFKMGMQAATQVKASDGLVLLQRYAEATQLAFLGVPDELPTGSSGLPDLLDDLRYISSKYYSLPITDDARTRADALAEALFKHLSADPRPVMSTVARLAQDTWELGRSVRAVRDRALYTMLAQSLKMLERQVPPAAPELAPMLTRTEKEAHESGKDDR